MLSTGFGSLLPARVEGLQLMRPDAVGLRTDTVATLLRRRLRTFADWCACNAATFLADI